MPKSKITLFSLFFFSLTITAYAQPYFRWAKNAGEWVVSTDRTIITDDSGNVFATGTFKGTVDFDPSSGTTNLSSSSPLFLDVFVSKLDSDGNLIWALQLGGANSNDKAIGVATDAAGNICIFGSFDGTSDFDPGPGVFNMTSVGFDDLFITKLDPNGNFLWARRLGGTSSEVGSSIRIDSSGNVYTVGTFQDWVDFDPGSTTEMLQPDGLADVFISKLDINGNFVWAKRVGGVDMEVAKSVTTDPFGNVFVTGHFNGTADFDPGIGTEYRTPAAWGDLFVLKLDPNGDFLWVKNVGVPYGANPVFGKSIATDASGNVYTTGSFKETADFDPGPGTEYLTATAFGGLSVFVLKLDVSGDFVWAKCMGPDITSAQANSIALDSWGNVYTTGYFNGTVDFDPGPGVENFASNGCFNLFISKLDSSGNYLWATALGETNSTFGYSITTDNSGGIYAAGEYTGTFVDLEPGSGVTNLSGYGRMYVLKLSECLPDETVASCDSYSWNGTTYYSSGVYTDTTHNGCEVNLNLTINNSGNSLSTETACGSYSWNGTTYSNSGTYDWTGTSSTGCDSTATLNLTLISADDITTSVNGYTINANNSAASYVWLDCDNSYIAIPGETGQFFTASVNGNYAVQITNNGCVDTSACVPITTLGISENSLHDFVLHPNPSEGAFSIDFNTQKDVIEMKIIDATGRKVAEKTFEYVDQIKFELNEPQGVYMVELSDGVHQRSIIKLVIE